MPRLRGQLRHHRVDRGDAGERLALQHFVRQLDIELIFQAHQDIHDRERIEPGRKKISVWVKVLDRHRKAAVLSKNVSNLVLPRHHAHASSIVRLIGALLLATRYSKRPAANVVPEERTVRGIIEPARRRVAARFGTFIPCYTRTLSRAPGCGAAKTFKKRLLVRATNKKAGETPATVR
jgi:hypothetical protein